MCSDNYVKWHKKGCRLLLALVLGFGVSSAGAARVLFEQDFESGSINSSPSPVWSWKAPISPGNIDTGMMYGESDVYFVTNTKSNSGDQALRLDFSGRNQWCNACGAKSIVLTKSALDSGCISTTGSPWGGALFDKTNGFSRWQITSSNSSEVCFRSSEPVGHSMFGSDSTKVSVGDTLLLPYQCGVNGNVGGDTSRKSDCNKAINYLNHVSSSDVGFGETLSRRFHIYIPSDSALPNTTFKLGYTHWKTEGGSTRSVKLKLSVQRGLQLELNAPNSETIVPKYYVQEDHWYYFEELFVRETSAGAGNAEYHLYVGKSGDDTGTPVISRVGFNLGALVDISMHGNWQHHRDVSGYVYFDDILISNDYAGPVWSGRPSAPLGLKANPL